MHGRPAGHFQMGEWKTMASRFRRRLVPALAAALTLALGGAALAQTQPNAIDASKFRAVGETRACINAHDIGATVPAGDKAILFNTVGNVWFRSNLKDGCPLLSEDQLPNWQKGIYLHNKTPDKYCASDRFTVIDNQTIVWLGQCTLGDFTPVAVP